MTVCETEVAVIGAGLAGLSAALHLARAGRRVAVLEAGYAGCGASGADFGSLSRNGRVLAELPLAARARDSWPRLKALVGDDCGFAATGHLALLRDRREMTAAEVWSKAAAGFELETEVIDGAALKRRYPWLSETVAGACWSPGCGRADPLRAMRAFERAALAAGAEVVESSAVTGADHDGRRFTLTCANGATVRADQAINCAGAGAGRVAALFGDRAPIEPVTLDVAVTGARPLFAVPVVAADGGAVFLRQTARGNLLIGGAAPGADVAAAAEGRARPEALTDLLRRALALAPRLGDFDVIRCWGRLDGRTPDGLPALGAGGVPGLWHGFGFSGHGFLLAPTVGEVLAELAIEGRTESPIESFDIARFG